MPPMPTEWWLRPVSSACRVGEHSAVVWKRVYFSPSAASRSAVGVDARAAERARGAEPAVVDQDDQHVRAHPPAAAAARSAGTRCPGPWRRRSSAQRAAAQGSAAHHEDGPPSSRHLLMPGMTRAAPARRIARAAVASASGATTPRHPPRGMSPQGRAVRLAQPRQESALHARRGCGPTARAAPKKPMKWLAELQYRSCRPSTASTRRTRSNGGRRRRWSRSGTPAGCGRT